MGNRKYLWIAGVLLVWAAVFGWMIPGWEGVGRLYGDWIFRPFQAVRGTLLNPLPFSLGDGLYLAFALTLVGAGIRMIVLMRKRGLKGHPWARGLVMGFWMVMGGMLFFFLGWGGNYYKPELREFWNLPSVSSESESGFVFFRFLGSEMNRLAPLVHHRPLSEVNREAKFLYSARTDLVGAGGSLEVKPSLFGSWLPFLGIQGYYNPFTGEAQVNAQMPSVLIPFVVCHEMAHQAGIAAEGDANFLAYLICRSSEKPDFPYSALLHIWLYTHHQLMSMDSARTRAERESLHPIVKADLEEIRNYHARYRGSMQRWSSRLYDYFLKWNRQPQGIRSYKMAGADVWAWENLPDSLKAATIILP